MIDNRGFNPLPQPKNPSLAFALELIGIVGLLGIGHISIGKTLRGFALMIGYILWWFLYAMFLILGIATISFSPFIFAFLTPLLTIGISIASGLWAKRTAEQMNQQIMAQWRAFPHQ